MLQCCHNFFPFVFFFSNLTELTDNLFIVFPSFQKMAEHEDSKQEGTVDLTPRKAYESPPRSPGPQTPEIEELSQLPRDRPEALKDVLIHKIPRGHNFPFGTVEFHLDGFDDFIEGVVANLVSPGVVEYKFDPLLNGYIARVFLMILLFFRYSGASRVELDNVTDPVDQGNFLKGLEKQINAVIPGYDWKVMVTDPAEQFRLMVLSSP